MKTELSKDTQNRIREILRDEGYNVLALYLSGKDLYIGAEPVDKIKIIGELTKKVTAEVSNLSVIINL